MDERILAIGVDPGLRYAGFCFGEEDETCGFTLNLDEDIQAPELLAVQHFDIVQDIIYSNDKSAFTRIDVHVEIGYSNGSCNRLNLLAESSECLVTFLSRLWSDYSTPINIHTHQGFETKEKRKSLGLNKALLKSSSSVQAHINDARALWSFAFPKIHAITLPSFTKEQEIYYCEFAPTIPDVFLEKFKNVIQETFENDPTDFSHAEQIRAKLLTYCHSKKSNKYDLLLTTSSYIRTLEESAFHMERLSAYMGLDEAAEIVDDYFVGRCDFELTA